MTTIRPEQRFTVSSPCPICCGHADMTRGVGERCAGFVSGRFAYCERVESPVFKETTTPPTWRHPLPAIGEEGGRMLISLSGDQPTPRKHEYWRSGGHLGRVVRRYRYIDTDGTLVRRAVRFDPKTFRPEHPVSDDMWLPGRGPGRDVLYRLSEVAAGIKDDRWIFNPEGEKDVNTLRAHGCVATCNDGGADGFRLGFAEQFTGAGLVVVIADRDPDLKGRRAAERRAAMIARFARDVRLVEFEDAKDVTDWFEQGHSLDELESIVSTATRVDDHGTPHMPGRSSTHDLEHLRLVSAASVNPEKVTFAWEDRIPIGMVSLLVGEGGLGKSLQMVTLAAGLTRGTIPGAFLGTPVRVAIATAEDHRASIVIPRLILAGADLSLIAFPELVVDGMADDIELTDQVEALEQLLTDGGVRVLFIDTVIAHMRGERVDTYNEKHVRAVLRPLARMAERSTLAVCGTMHLNRRDSQNLLTRISGSGGFGNLARLVMLLARDPDDPEPDGPMRVLAVGKTNVGVRPSSLRLRVETGWVTTAAGDTSTPTIVTVGDVGFTAGDLLGAQFSDADRSKLEAAMDFLTTLLSDGPMLESAIDQEAKRVGVASSTLRRAKTRLKVRSFHKGGMGSPWCWELPSSIDVQVNV